MLYLLSLLGPGALFCLGVGILLRLLPRVPVFKLCMSTAGFDGAFIWSDCTLFIFFRGDPSRDEECSCLWGDLREGLRTLVPCLLTDCWGSLVVDELGDVRSLWLLLKLGIWLFWLLKEEDRIGFVGETMSGTGDSSRFSKLGRSGTGGRRENWENWASWLDRGILWYLFCQQ